MRTPFHRLLPLATLFSALSLTPVRAADEAALYRTLGEQAGLTALSQDFVARLKADAQIGRYFKDVASKHLATQLAAQFCAVSGGPCRYEGETMKKSHADLGIDAADFNRLVEVLQDAMDQRGIDFGAQTRLLALLAPMHREIVTAR